MSPERWQQVEEIFERAIDLAPAERPCFLREACGADEDLRAEVEALVGADEAASDFIETPAIARGALSLAGEWPPQTETNTEMDDGFAGRCIGSYRLVSELGRGGMGVVYLAERADSEFRKRVAIKLIKRGMDTDFILRRFRHERQMLANLEHTNIARLIDGGTTDDGLPFFVMEYIEGAPLYEFCDQHQLTVAERLKIFCQICGAVSYAHQHKIVHRDIKPSNVLVTHERAPKLLDFGIAKLLDADTSGQTNDPTQTALRLMTPEYAAPEQVQGQRVSPATDVYALGVLLYEMLTGHRPYQFPSRSPHELSRTICETEPELPSRVVAREDETLLLASSGAIQSLDIMCRAHGANVESLSSQLAGDLDNILMKALRKDPSARYQMVNDLCGDITRHLEHRPVAAPVYSTTRRIETIASRDAEEHKPDENSLAVLPFSLLTPTAPDDTGDEYLGLGLADALITRLSGLRRFVVRPTSSVLRFGGRDAGDPLEAGRKLGVSFVLDARIQRAGEKLRVTAQMLELATGATRWAEIFDERFADILDLQDRIAMRVAESITPHLSGDERQQLAKRGTDNAQAFEAYLRGRYHWNTFTEEGFAKAINCYHQAIAYDEAYALPYTGIADYFNWLGVYGVLPSDECCAASKEAATRAIELDPNLAEAYTTLAFALHTEFDWRHQEQLHLRALELSPNYATAHVWYSLQLTMEGRFDEALREARRAIELDPLNSFSQHHLGWVLYHARRYDESIAHYERMFLAEPRYGIARFSYAWALRQVGRCDEAIDEARRAIELMGDNPFVVAGLGAAYARAGRTEEARSILHQLEATRIERYVSPYHLALICCNLGDAECAFTLIEQALTQRDFWVVWLGIEPQLDLLRTDSRYADLLRRINYPGVIATPREELIIDGLKTNQAIESLAGKTADNTTKTESAAAGASSHIKVADEDWAHPSQSNFLPLSSLARHNAVWRVGAVFAAFALLSCLALALFLRTRTTPTPGTTTQASATNSLEANTASNTEKRSLAVLPFTTVGASGDDQYLGVGLADLVTNKLSSLEAVSVRTSNAVRRYLNTKSASIDVGRELGVDYILSGAVTRDGEWMHTRLELSDVRANRVLWSEVADEPFVDIVALQDSVSERIANALKLRLTSDERNRLRHRYTEDSAAYQFYLAGRYHLGKRTADGLRQAITSFEQASQRDARFALAYAGLADSYALLNWYIEPPPADAFRRAKEAAIKAVELDSDLAEAHASLAFIRFHYDRDSAGAAEEFRRAIMLKPNYPTAHHWYAFTLSAMGQHDEALREVRRAEELDPRSAIIATAVANVLYHARRFDESIAQCRKALELDPGAVGAHVVMRWAYERVGRYDEAFAVFEKERAFAGDTPTTRAKHAHVLAAAGRSEEARNILRGLLADRAQQWVTPYEIAVIYALLNERDAAFAWLERAEREHVVGFTFVQVDPHLDSLRDDPRFAHLLHAVSQKQ